MNCDGFEAVIGDLGRGLLMEASVRDEALSHTASCAHCEVRLADERELTAGLRKLATVWTAEPSAQVETSLLAAFKQQRSKFRGGSAGLVGVASAPRKNLRWIYVAAGVAALIVIALMLSLTISRTRDSREPQKPERAATAPPVPNPQNDQHVKPIPPPDIKQQVVSSGAPDVRTGAVKQAHGKQRRPPAQHDSNASAEIATEFFPLNRDGIGQFDSAQVVRVELPRSAMMSFGLPINMDRADERIKADVVVGNDGMARAIRFVR